VHLATSDGSRERVPLGVMYVGSPRDDTFVVSGPRRPWYRTTLVEQFPELRLLTGPTHAAAWRGGQSLRVILTRSSLPSPEPTARCVNA